MKSITKSKAPPHLDLAECPFDAGADADVSEVEGELLPLYGAHPREEAVLHRAVLVLEK